MNKAKMESALWNVLVTFQSVKALCFLNFSGEKFGIPSNTESKSQHDSDKELYYFFFSLSAC